MTLIIDGRSMTGDPKACASCDDQEELRIVRIRNDEDPEQYIGFALCPMCLVGLEVPHE